MLGPSGNVRAGHVGIHCPECPDDDKYHYAMDLSSGKVRGCWRDPAHWMSGVELIQRLAYCSHNEAVDIYHDEISLTATSLAAMLKQMEDIMPTTAVKTKLEPVQMPRSFRLFSENPSHQEKRYHDYLVKRGYDDPASLSYLFDLRWCDDGPFAGRIVFPVKKRRMTYGWTARTIGKAKARYKAGPDHTSMAGFLWESRQAFKDDVLIVVEGPFDALRVASVLDSSAVVVALMTNHAGPEKLDRLLEIGGKTDHTIICLDQGAESHAMQLSADLAVLGPEVRYLPQSVGDPGEMHPTMVRAFFA